MIVGAALVPHTPLLLTTVGRERLKNLQKTQQANATVLEHIHRLQPDTIVTMSGHGTIYPDAFSVNLHEPYTLHFEEFGDFSTHANAWPDFATIDQLKRHLRSAQIPFTLDTHAPLDFGTAVPLVGIIPLLSRLKIIPLAHSGLDFKSHFMFGSHAREILAASSKRIFILGTGDMSHRLSTDAPGGFSPKGPAFDTAIQQLLLAKNTAGLLSLDQDLVDEAGECVMRSLLMLTGMLDKVPYETRLLSYEAAFGVGYLTAIFDLP